MMESWRPLVCAAALIVTAGIDVADAQTVIATNASPGSTVELVLNADTIGSATVAPDGDATLPVDLLAKAGKTETSAHVFVDVCPNLVRVLLVEGAVPPPIQGACNRTPITGAFVVRGVTTFVIDVGRPDPVMWLRQGPAPPQWLGETSSSRLRRGRTWGAPPTNLVLSGSAGLAQLGDVVRSACGNVTTCTGNDYALGYRVGAAYWMKPFLAADVSYVKPQNAIVNGSGDAFHFQNILETQMVTVAGNVGVPIGPARLYGQAGGNYHRATSTTTETIDAAGTQTFTLKTAGWGWLFGGGGELWITRYVAIYGELGRAQLKGAAVNGGEGAIDDHATFVLVGGRIHVGR